MLKKFTKAERPPSPPPEPLLMPLPPKPMLRFYLLGWGVPLIICGITAAVNMDHYAGREYCYLSWDPGLGAFYGPVALLVGINLIYFLRISCVIRGSTNNPSYSEETEELHVNEIELSPNQDTHHHHHHHPHPAVTGPVPGIQAAHHHHHHHHHHRSGGGGGSTVSGGHHQLPDNRSIHSDDSNISSVSSILDEERRPITQLRALVTFLFLFILTWVCAAFAIAQPFRLIIPKQGLIFSYLYGLASIVLGGFLVGFFCLLRDDSRACWRRFFCCEKAVDVFEVAPTNLNHMTHINGHMRSGSSVDGESLTGKVYNIERQNKVKVIDHPVKQSNLIPIQPPSFTDGSVSSAHETNYPNFYNPRQNGVAKKFWEKNRHNHLKLINKEINKDVSDFNSVNLDDPTKRYSHCTSSDGNTHWSIEIQIQANPESGKDGNIGGHQQELSKDHLEKSPCELPLNIQNPPSTPQPVMFPSLPFDRNKIPPVGGPTSPETITASPSCSFISPSGSQTLPHCHSPGASSLGSYQHLSAFTPVQPKRCNTLPNIGKQDSPSLSNEYALRDGSVPRLRDSDGHSETSIDKSAIVGHAENNVLQGYLPPGPTEGNSYNNNNNNNNKDSNIMIPASGQALIKNSIEGSVDINDQATLYGPHSHPDNNNKKLLTNIECNTEDLASVDGQHDYHHHHHHQYHHHNQQQQSPLPHSHTNNPCTPHPLSTPPNSHGKYESDDNNSGRGDGVGGGGCRGGTTQLGESHPYMFHESDSQISRAKNTSATADPSSTTIKNHDSDHHSDPTHHRRHRIPHGNRHTRLSKQHSLGWEEQFKDRPPKVPYAYVNHSYQEKVIQKLLKKCQEEGSETGPVIEGSDSSTGSNLYWFPRSFSSYEQNSSMHERKVEKLTEDGNSGSESSSDSECLDIWLPQEDSLSSKFKKETSV